MNYEEAYKEAIERCKSWMRGEHPECFTEAQKAGEYIFPELKESEDERIRKILKDFVNQHFPVTSTLVDKIKILDWLEKQENNKLTGEEVDDIFKQGQDSVIDNPEKFGLQKKCEWSEEDERRFEYCKRLVYASDKYSIEDREETVDWLKSIKDRVSQPHWKPSEEQMNALDKAKNSPANYHDIRLGLQSLYNDLLKL